MELQLIYVATLAVDSKENSRPIIEPDCDVPSVYLRIWNQFIVARVTTWVLFIFYLHSIQFNLHKDHAEEAIVIITWIITFIEMMVGAFPYHLRDMFISQTSVSLVIWYLVILSFMGKSIFSGMNFVQESSIAWMNATIVTLVALLIDVCQIAFGKIKNKVFGVVNYAPEMDMDGIHLVTPTL
jgi:hypothetical protein